MSSSLSLVEGWIGVGLRDENSLYNSLELPDPSDDVADAFGIDPLPLSDCEADGVSKEAVDDEGEGTVGGARGGRAGCANADASSWEISNFVRL